MVVKSVKSESEFNRLVGNPQLTVVDFYAEWCGPCKAIAPVFESLSTKYSKAQFLRVDVDQLQSVAQRYGVAAMPTFQFFRSGKQLDEVVGADPGTIESKLKQLLDPSSGRPFPDIVNYTVTTHISPTLNEIMCTHKAGGSSSSGYVLGSGKKVGPGLTEVAAQQNTHTWLFIAIALFMLYHWWNKPSGEPF